MILPRWLFSRRFIEKGAVVRAHDPKGVEEAKRLLPPGIDYCEDIYETLRQADAAILMTEWNAYRGLDMTRVARDDEEAGCSSIFATSTSRPRCVRTASNTCVSGGESGIRKSSMVEDHPAVGEGSVVPCAYAGRPFPSFPW